MKLVRPLVEKIHAYTPGEQPNIRGLVKLNTNENPYPPSPRVLAAVRKATDGRLRLYPDPTASALRTELARYHKCSPENIIVGNGSDELLALVIRCFVEPAGSAKRRSSETVQYFTPSYSLYSVLAAIHGARTLEAPLTQEFDFPNLNTLSRKGGWDPKAALTFVTTPNAPSGRAYSLKQLDAICRRQKGVVVLDEAYVDFAPANAMKLALKYPHVIVSRTFSKSYSLCFQRVGYFVGHEKLISALHKIRDSYNVNGLGQVAALETIRSLPYYRKNIGKIIATRNRVARDLHLLGFEVLPSQTNFLLVRPPGKPAREWLAEFRSRKILVRWFNHPRTSDYLRISIGTDLEMNTLLRAVRQILQNKG